MGRYQETIERLVQHSQEVAIAVEERHTDKVKLYISDETKNGTDMSGWVLRIHKLETRWGFSPEDQYFPCVARIEISELELNSGDPVVTLYEWLNDSGEIEESSGSKISMTPHQLIEYLDNILNTGIAYLQIAN